MQAATLVQLKRTLRERPAHELLEHCLRLAKYSRDNKELLTYLALRADDEEGYLEEIKQDIDDAFWVVPRNNIWRTKRAIRKIVKALNKHVKFSGRRDSEVELRLHFCRRMRESELPYRKNSVLSNLYDAQVKKTRAAYAKLHEDLQFDYGERVRELTLDPKKKR